MKMKRLVCLIFFSVIVSYSVSAVDFFAPTVVDVRSSGMGKSYLCDFDQPFVMLNNPSGMMFSGKQVFLPTLAFDLGLPPKAPSMLFDMVKSNGNTNIVNTLVELLKGSNGIYMDGDIMLPLTFSVVANNWGIGLYNNVFVRADLPSVSSMTATAGGDLFLVGGFSCPIIDEGIHKVSLGITAELLGRFGIYHQGSVTGLTSIDFSTLPAFMTLGMGFDIGATYNVWDILSISAVWKDLYLGMDKNLGAISSMSFSDNGEWKKFLQSGDLTLGLGVQVPTGVLEKVLTSFAVYVDYANITKLFNREKAIFLPHPLLDLSVGMEAILFKTIALRFGMTGPYLAGGLGIDLGPFHMSMSLYGKEKGLDPGSSPQVHGAFSLAFYY